MHRRPAKAGFFLTACLVAAFAVAGLAQDAGPPAPAVPAPSVPAVPEAAPVAPPAPPADVRVSDANGQSSCVITVSWSPSPTAGVTGYVVRRGEPAVPSIFAWLRHWITGRALPSADAVAEFEPLETVGAGAASFDDVTCEFGTKYVFQVAAAAGKAESAAARVGPFVSNGKWVDSRKLNVFLLGFIVCASILYYIRHARKGREFFIRKIAGLESVDEAIGRATEMGKPILFIPGIMDMNDVQTVAAVIILGRIAKTIAEYDTKLFVPTSHSLVMTTARETVKEAYIAAGRPDAYNDDMITYLTDEQFGYVAGINGIMVREKPATCIYLGSFYAESLILAETGNSIGAIQIAGTAQPSQLPFFIAACDYTLIGEELFAASAYLSHEPMQLGSLKGQDVGKAMAMAAILLGSLLQTSAAFLASPWIHTVNGWIAWLFTAIE